MNIVVLQGRLAADPEGGQSGNGVSYATFSVALERGSGENMTVTYLDCVTFRQQADFVRQYFHKGDGINVSGSINVRDWTDDSGIKHRKFEVIANQISFPVSKARSGGARASAPRNGDPVPAGAGAGGAPSGSAPAPQPWDDGY